MREFLSVAFGFPTALLTFSLVVVAGYWLLVLVGGLGPDTLDGDGDGFLAAAGFGGVPVSIVLSLFLAFAWFGSLTGSVLVSGMALESLALVLALAVAWLLTRLLVLPLRRVFRAGAAPSRLDFVGRTCVIRTGRVGIDFGQAEVAAEDGSTALVQVRVPDSDLPVAGAAGGAALALGSTALIFDYDAAEGTFLVMPDPTSGPRARRT